MWNIRSDGLLLKGAGLWPDLFARDRAAMQISLFFFVESCVLSKS